MRIVLDTNALVSGLLSPNGAPARVLMLVASGDVTVCYDARILDEYARVLRRPRFDFPAIHVDAILAQLESEGLLVAARPLGVALTDPGDAPFLEVSVSGGVDAMVTGNSRHFPPEACPVPVLSPAEMLERMTRHTGP